MVSNVLISVGTAGQTDLQLSEIDARIKIIIIYIMQHTEINRRYSHGFKSCKSVPCQSREQNPNPEKGRPFNAEKLDTALKRTMLAQQMQTGEVLNHTQITASLL